MVRSDVGGLCRVALTFCLFIFITGCGVSNNEVDDLGDGTGTDSDVGDFYTLPADRVTRWQPGVTYNGGIPDRTTKCAYVCPSGSTPTPAGCTPSTCTGCTVTGSADTTGATDSVAIQSAVNACPVGQVVQLGPGTFYVDGAHNPTNASGGIWLGKAITLRGSGAGETVGSTGPGTVVASALPGGSNRPIAIGWPSYYWPSDTEHCGGQTHCTSVAIGSVDPVPGLIPLVEDAAKEDSFVVVSTATVNALSPALQVGELVNISEQWDANITWWGDLGGGQCTGNGMCGFGQDWADPLSGTDQRYVARPVGQADVIAAITDNGDGTTTISFAAPLHSAFRVDFAADVARIIPNQPGTTGIPNQPGLPVSGVGVEDLSVANGGGGDAWANIYIVAAVDSWVKNVESFNANGGSISFDNSFRCEVRDSFLHTAGWPNPGGAGYGIEINTYAADNLFENSIVWSFNKVSAVRSSGGGNVFGYNYFEDGYGAGYPNIVEVGGNASHMAGSHMELFEGNQAFNFGSDSGWGNQNAITFFRNHATTLRRNIGNGTGTTQCQSSGNCPLCDGAFSCSGPVVALTDLSCRVAIQMTVHQLEYNFVGNVLGFPSDYLQSPAIGYAYSATFSSTPPGGTWVYEWTGINNEGIQPCYSGRPYIWQLGFSGTTYDATPDQPSTQTNYDSINYPTGTQTSISTMLRDGNFDYATNAVHWHGIGENICSNGNDPAACATECVTPPAVATLPSSLYIPSSMQPPAFFGGSPWPWVDGSSADNPLPGTLPARTRFDNGTPNDVTY